MFSPARFEKLKSVHYTQFLLYLNEGIQMVTENVLYARISLKPGLLYRIYSHHDRTRVMIAPMKFVVKIRFRFNFSRNVHTLTCRSSM